MTQMTLEISEQVFAAIQRQAAAIGVAPEYLIATLLEQQFVQASEQTTNAAEQEAARAKFERHFGTLEVDNGIDIDNEGIDADLAKEYTSTHEEV